MTQPHQDFAFHTSIRTASGRVLVHITRAALDKLRSDTDSSDLSVLARHLPQVHAVALQLAARSSGPDVTVDAGDVWWRPEAASPQTSQAA